MEIVGNRVDGRLCYDAHCGSRGDVGRVVGPTRDLNERNGGGSRISPCSRLRVHATDRPRDGHASRRVARGEGVPFALVRPKRLNLIAALLQEHVRTRSRHQVLQARLDQCRENKRSQHAGSRLGRALVVGEHAIGQDCT